MTQVIFGAALGCLLGEAVFHGLKQLGGWLQRVEVSRQARELASLRGSALLRGFIKYAGVFGTIAALGTLSVWTIGDYLSAGPARDRAVMITSAPALAVGAPHTDADTRSNDSAPAAPRGRAVSDTAIADGGVDPYADSEFRVQRRPHRPGAALSLKETLVQRAEARARADLLRQTQEHVRRSQYDCEAAERANKYLDAGLDVWGFASWQLKYFPMDHYRGATLTQCKGIRDLLDPSKLASRPVTRDENDT